MEKDLIDRRALLKKRWSAIGPDGAPVPVIALEDIESAQSFGFVPENSIPVILSKAEIDMILESLDIVGDRIADRQGYSSGEVYWDLKEKIDAHRFEFSKPQQLDKLISAAESKSVDVPPDKSSHTKEPEPEL